MKRLQMLVALSLLAAAPAFAQQAAAPAAQAEQAWKYQAKRLARADVDALLAQPDKVTVLDVRRPDELTAKGGFPVYLNIQAKEVENNLAYIPRDRVIVTVSNHAGRAGAVADLLAARGFNVAGATGAEDYAAQGGTITRWAAPAKP
jgi:rhodanese-related sulfurtransferase